MSTNKQIFGIIIGVKGKKESEKNAHTMLCLLKHKKENKTKQSDSSDRRKERKRFYVRKTNKKRFEAAVLIIRRFYCALFRLFKSLGLHLSIANAFLSLCVCISMCVLCTSNMNAMSRQNLNI